MFYHFKWTIILVSRKIKDWGLNPIIAYILISIFLLIIPALAMHRMQYFEYIYSFIALYFLIAFSKNNRNEFLKNYFKKSTYKKIRISENLLFVAPIVIVLIINRFFILSAVNLLLALLLSFVVFRQRSKYVIPTPFYKRPFEFIRGYRFSFPFIFFLDGVIIMAIIYNNYMLGIISLLLIFLIFVGYYSYAEPEYYVWTNSMNAKQFLIDKIKTAIIFSTLINIIPTVAMSIFFPSHILFILLACFLGYLYLIFIILQKYSNYPDTIDIIDQIIFIICMIIPVLFIVLIPFMYKKALLKLKYYL